MNRIKQRISDQMDDNEEYGDPGPMALGWWLLALVIPLVGFVMGITEFAANRVGMGIALWGTSALGVWGWICLGTVS